jgi:hypothetical protein
MCACARICGATGLVPFPASAASAAEASSKRLECSQRMPHEHNGIGRQPQRTRPLRATAAPPPRCCGTRRLPACRDGFRQTAPMKLHVAAERAYVHEQLRVPRPLDILGTERVPLLVGQRVHVQQHVRVADGAVPARLLVTHVEPERPQSARRVRGPRAHRADHDHGRHLRRGRTPRQREARIGDRARDQKARRAPPAPRRPRHESSPRREPAAPRCWRGGAHGRVPAHVKQNSS